MTHAMKYLLQMPSR